MSKIIIRPFQTDPADGKGVANLKCVLFKTANNTATAIGLKTDKWISNDDRVAKLEIDISKLSFVEMMNQSSKSFGPEEHFNVDQLHVGAACAEGTFHDDHCLPPLPPPETGCSDPQSPFVITDCKGNAFSPKASAFGVKGSLEGYPEHTVVSGLMVLFLK